MNNDFERFIRACKEWATSDLVADIQGLMWPTYLLKTSSDQLVWGEFWGGHGANFWGGRGRTLTQIRDEISGYLANFEPTAFAVILPLERDDIDEIDRLLPTRARFGESCRPWEDWYQEAALVQAFSIDGAQCDLLGLAEYGIEEEIDCWVTLPFVPGPIADAVEQAAADWRAREKAAV